MIESGEIAEEKQKDSPPEPDWAAVEITFFCKTYSVPLIVLHAGQYYVSLDGEDYGKMLIQFWAEENLK